MRQVLVARLRAGLIAAAVGLASPASAQSFLQNLFGMGQAAPQHDRNMVRPGAPAAAGPVRPDAQWSREIRRYSPAAATQDAAGGSAEEIPQSTSSGGKYRTLCVRTCDGYYFPIGNSVSRQRFMRDAAQCRASCGEEARLFYLPAQSDNVSTMLDLAGRSYVRMPTAFKYRKSLTDGCTCRPMPWSAAELQRHQRYADEAARAAAEAEAKRLAAEAAEAERTGRTNHADGSQKTDKDKPRPGQSEQPSQTVGTYADGTLKFASTAAAAAGSTSSPTSVAGTGTEGAAADLAVRKSSARADRSRTLAAGTSSDRPQAARRQNAVAYSPATKSGGSWFAPSGAKYTWPGDPPSR